MNAFLPVVIFGVVLSVIVIAAWYQDKKTSENLAKLAARLGLKLETTGKFVKKHRLVGEIRAKPVEIYKYTTGSGKSQQTWAALAVTAKKTGGLTFSLERRVAFLELFARFFRKNETKTGDVAFDSSWVLKTNQPGFLQAALLPEMRTKLMPFASGGASSPSFKLEVSRVVYAEQGSFSSGDVCDRFAEAVDVVCDLADVVEVGAEMKNSPS